MENIGSGPSSPATIPFPTTDRWASCLVLWDAIPAHIHFIVQAVGFEPITTHIFVRDCPYLSEDPVFGVKPSLIADLQYIAGDGDDSGLGDTGSQWQIQWDFVLCPQEAS
jgi:protocatechuate 3,4-dioxygenase beta subunit